MGETVLSVQIVTEIYERLDQNERAELLESLLLALVASPANARRFLEEYVTSWRFEQAVGPIEDQNQVNGVPE
jgi:hypothetical protein